MGGMMDFVMLGVMVLGGAFLWINKDSLACTFNPNSPECGGVIGPDCTLEPNAAGCGSDPTSSSDCGKLCRDKKCTDYKKSCKTGCKYCCGSGPNSPKCGGTPGSQCGNLCSTGQCLANWNQCSTDCSKCPWANAAKAVLAAGHTQASAFNFGCGRYSNPVGVRCGACRVCSNGARYCSPAVLIGGKTPSAVVTEILNAWKKAHPAGCTTGTGCTKTCSGGYVLNKTACTCNCNKDIKGCTGCLKVTPTTCTCYKTGNDQTGSGSGCNSGYHRCSQPDGRCGCCKNPTSGGTGCPGSQGNCNWDCHNAYCWTSKKSDGKTYRTCTKPGQTTNRPNGCALARNVWCAVNGPCSSYTGLPGAGPYGDYKYADTGRVPERVRLAA